MKRIGIFLSILFLAACSTDDIASDSEVSQFIPVEVAQVQELDLEKTLDLNGQALPSTIIPLFTPSPLEVQDVQVKVGDKVTTGDLLIKLDQTQVKSQVEQAKKVVTELEKGISKAKELQASNQQSIQELKVMEQELEKSLTNTRSLIEDLGEEDSTTTILTVIQEALEFSLKQAELAQAAGRLNAFPQINVNELEMQLDVAKGNVKQLERALEATKLTSPIEGVVAELNVIKDQLALPNTPLATIVNLNPINATFFVNSYEVTKLQPGMTATIEVEGLRDSFISEIETVAPTINPQTNLFEVKISIPNDQHVIKGGMRISAYVHLENIERALVIPIDSVLYSDNEPYVFIVEEDTSIHKNIVLGMRSGIYVEVVEGLQNGQRVVTRGKERLTDGSEITIRNE